MHGRVITMKHERSAEHDFKLQMIGAGLFVALAPVYAIFSHYNQEDRGFLIVSITIVFCAVAYVRRAALRLAVFSMVLAILYIVQIVVAAVVPIPSRYPGFVMVPLAFLDLVIVLGVMSLVERQVRTPKPGSD